MTIGYSGKPLAHKLGLKDGQRVGFVQMPDNVRADIDSAGLALIEARLEDDNLDLVHIFSKHRLALESSLSIARQAIIQNGMIWVSWPKKAAKVPTDITEDTIRDLAFPLGLVDVKVCAVDAIWSGLKLVIRKEMRR